MKQLTRIMKPVSWVLVMIMLHLCWVSSIAWAKMIETDAVIHSEAQTDRERLQDLLDRKGLQEQFEQYGISKAEVLARVDSLTDEEVAALVTEIDQVPEGGYAAELALITLLGIGTVVVLVVLFVGGVILTVKLFQSAFRDSPKNTSGETKSKSTSENQPLKTGPGELG